MGVFESELSNLLRIRSAVLRGIIIAWALALVFCFWQASRAHADEPQVVVEVFPLFISHHNGTYTVYQGDTKGIWGLITEKECRKTFHTPKLCK